MATTESGIETRVLEGREKVSVGVPRYFSEPGVDPYDAVEWETREALIPGKDGPSFQQPDVEFPAFWSQTATNIVAQKYFRGKLNTPQRERSVKQMIGRVADTITNWGVKDGYFTDGEEAEVFHAELTHLLLHQMASFNSPVWFNVGFEENPQCSACFILSVDDSMDSILEWITKEGRIFRGGSGSGINLSRIRSSKEQLSKGGYASGPVSFMRGADASAGTIKSGGKTRRAAKMVVLNIDHPDIEEFIWCKQHEEEKARVLQAAGYDMSLDSPDWASIQYQNANNSVRVTDEFMRAVLDDEDWDLTARMDGSVVRTLRARDLMRQVAEAAWKCADPGMHYDTTMNDWHTCPASGRINASNPCSEYLHVDNSACNLASLNLMKFRSPETDEFEVERVRAGGGRGLHGPGDPGLQLQLPDRRDHAQRARDAAAGHGLRQPGRAADGPRAALRLRRGPRLRRRDHGDHDRPGVPQVGRDGQPDRLVRRVPEELRGDAAGDPQAPRGGRQHRPLAGARGHDRRGAQRLERGAGAGRAARLPQRAGDRARPDRHHLAS